MKIPKDAQFLEELEQYALRLTCEYCVHYNTPEDRCSLLWPNADHRLTTVLSPDATHIIFCKEFDLN